MSWHEEEINRLRKTVVKFMYDHEKWNTARLQRDELVKIIARWMSLEQCELEDNHEDHPIGECVYAASYEALTALKEKP